MTIKREHLFENILNFKDKSIHHSIHIMVNNPSQYNEPNLGHKQQNIVKKFHGNDPTMRR